jgi:hypothetical protein
MDNIDKVTTAIKTLKPDAQFVWYGNNISTEEEFNKIEWSIGTNADGTANLTLTNPHSEITWTKFKEEYDKL